MEIVCQCAVFDTFSLTQRKGAQEKCPLPTEKCAPDITLLERLLKENE